METTIIVLLLVMLFVVLVRNCNTKKQIVDLKKHIKTLEHTATHDALTGLPNRVLLRDRFEHARDYAVRHKTTIGLLYMDLDKFKPINDIFGHAVGDQILKQVSHRFKKVLRASDTISRVGGDEFVAIIENVDVTDVRNIIYKIEEEIKQPYRVFDQYSKERIVTVGISTGCVITNRFEPEHIDMILTVADQAMYNAKKLGMPVIQS